MSEPDLHAAVARAIADRFGMNSYPLTDGELDAWADKAAAAAIRVVLAETQRSIEALRQYGLPEAAAERAAFTRVLAALAALGEQAPVPYDEPMIGGPHEVTNQYHSEPDRDPRQ